MKRLTGVLLLIVGLLVVVPAVFAGGWAMVTMDELPAEVHAGETFTIGFTVLQHGETPVHDLGAGYPVEPLIVARTIPTGERVEFEAFPTKKPGHFQADITLPSEGNWAWSITPRPFGEQVLEPLTVLPAAETALVGTQASVNNAAAGGLTSQSLLRALGIGLGAAGLIVYLWQRRQSVNVPQIEG